MSPSATILIVEDDENLRLALTDNLEDEGYRVLSTARGGEAGELVRHHEVDLVILDVMLPDVDGYAVCRGLRGFETGADDYLTKPYRLAELLVRVRALLRRRGAVPTQMRELAGFTLDTAGRTLKDPAGRDVHLTRTEFDLLAFLLSQAGRALTRDRILDEVWGDEVVVDARTVDNFVSSLKKKLGWRPDAGFRIETVRGVGYRLEIDSP